jgi:Transposase
MGRVWSSQEKQCILDEAGLSNSNFSIVARKYNISTSQLFRWRKTQRLRGQRLTHDKEYPSLHELLDGIDQFEKLISPLVVEKFLRDVRTGDITSYNACNGYSALVNALCKIISLKLMIQDRGQKPIDPVKQAVEDKIKSTPVYERDVARVAELLLVELAKQEVSRGIGVE